MFFVFSAVDSLISPRHRARGNGSKVVEKPMRFGLAPKVLREKDKEMALPFGKFVFKDNCGMIYSCFECFKNSSE